MEGVSASGVTAHGKWMKLEEPLASGITISSSGEWTTATKRATVGTADYANSASMRETGIPGNCTSKPGDDGFENNYQPGIRLESTNMTNSQLPIETSRSEDEGSWTANDAKFRRLIPPSKVCGDRNSADRAQYLDNPGNDPNNGTRNDDETDFISTD